MKSNIKKLEHCKVRMTVEVEARLVENRFQEVLREFQRTATLPGFRQGRAPMKLVEKQYQGEVYEEVLKSLVPEAYHQSAAEHKVSPVSLPSISDIRMARGKALSFAAEFEKAPEFNLRNHKGIRIRKPVVSVSPEDVEKGIASLLEARAEFVPLLEERAIRKGDILLTDVEVWKDGRYLEGRKGVSLAVRPSPADDFFEKVVGASAGQAIEVSAGPTEEEKKQGLVGRKPVYRITVRTIQEKRLPPLDDALARSFGKQTVTELREAIHKDIIAARQSDSYESMKVQLFEKLLSMTAFELPQGLVKKQKERLAEQSRRELQKLGLPGEEREALEKKWLEGADEKAARQVRLYFILEKVAESENIRADEAELEARVAALVEESGRPAEEVRRVFEEDIRESLKEKKTVEFLLAHAKLEETP